MAEPIHIPLPSLKRFSIYLLVLEKFENMKWISTTFLSHNTGIKPITIRKDISYLLVKGQPKRGFLHYDLHTKLKIILGGDNYKDLVIIGSWGLGEAYLKYPELLGSDYKLRACFDFVEHEDNSSLVPVFPICRAEELIKRLGVTIVLFSINPSDYKLIDAEISKWDIKGILNLTPIKLKSVNPEIKSIDFNPLLNIPELVAKIRL